MDRMQMEMDTLSNLNAQLVDSIVQLQALVRHGHDNPIVVKDSNDKGETLAEGSEGIAKEHLLVEIMDGTPEREIMDDCEESPEL